MRSLESAVFSHAARYTKALEYRGNVVLTAPYLDVGGAGYIVTVSHTIYKGKLVAFDMWFL